MQNDLSLDIEYDTIVMRISEEGRLEIEIEPSGKVLYLNKDQANDLINYLLAILPEITKKEEND